MTRYTTEVAVMGSTRASAKGTQRITSIGILLIHMEKLVHLRNTVKDLAVIVVGKQN